jgi:hypothetical protein
MSNDGLIIENMDLSHIHLAVCNLCTEVRFAIFLSNGFATMAVMNPPKKKLEKRISVQCSDLYPAHGMF